MRRVTRRDFLQVSALGLGAVVVSTGMSGCGGSSGSSRGRKVGFRHGVASGDPLSDRVLLWTRVTPEDFNTTAIEVGWEVATDADFTDLVHSGTAEVSFEHDYTLKVDVLDLLPGSTYHYRFRAAGELSPSGVTRTLPQGSVTQVKFAVLSCSNYPAGYFNVYAEAAKEQGLDAVLHLGDYLYEYDSQGYAGEDAEAMGRLLPAYNDVELLTLLDYRRRYAHYRTDTYLQALHASAPFIAVWDDHEIANDTWREGAENHDPATEGDFLVRKLQALQAYFEWMPVRPAMPDDEEIIYRSFDFGDLVSLHMLDTRVIGRDEQINYADYLTTEGINLPAFQAAMGDPNRSLLGAEPRLWLQNQLMSSSATWQVLGQQVLMARIHMPAEMLQGVLARDPALIGLIAELTELKGRYLMNDPSLTPGEIARVITVLPYNLDAWDGYVVERETLLGTARAAGKNLVVLAGDTHNAWGSNLTDMDGNAAGVEFATASVSSPGLEEYLQLPPEMVPTAEQAISLLVDDLHYLNASQRGYLLVTFTASEARADWRYVSTVKGREYSLDDTRARSLVVQAGSNVVAEIV
jgi:alkaline phosphatase D